MSLLLHPRAEFFAAALKAARGAGWPLAQGEDFARALMLAGDEAAAAEFADLLAKPLDPICQEDTGPPVTLTGATALVWPAALDHLGAGLGPVLVPAGAGALLPCLAQIAGADVVPAASGGMAELRHQRPASDRVSTVGPLAISEKVWSEIDRFAQHTYVPSSAQSRASGAGAGLTDND